jgi:Concanavalin A-like lectin/glucanases superfamily
VVSLTLLPGAGLVSAATAGAATVLAGCGSPAVVAHWAMDEPAGAATMIDSVGGFDGKIQYAETGLTEPAHAGFGSFYRFGRGTEFPKGSMVTVADAPALDPGLCDFTVDVWVDWDAVKPDANNHTTYNVTQKGLSTAPANWKVEVDGGQKDFATALCTFDGANDGKGPVRVRSAARVANDGRWTALHCERHGNDFTVSVNDGTPVKATVAGIGAIENSSALTVGTKKLNDSDTFPGEIDDLVYAIAR